MTEKHISVRIFPSVRIVNSAQLIFKKSYKNIAEKTQEIHNLVFFFSLEWLFRNCVSAGASWPRWFLCMESFGSRSNPCPAQCGVNTSLCHPSPCVWNLPVWSELDFVPCGLAVLPSPGVIWAVCVSLAPLAVCWPWMSHAAGWK